MNKKNYQTSFDKNWNYMNHKIKLFYTNYIFKIYF